MRNFSGFPYCALYFGAKICTLHTVAYIGEGVVDPIFGGVAHEDTLGFHVFKVCGKNLLRNGFEG